MNFRIEKYPERKLDVLGCTYHLLDAELNIRARKIICTGIDVDPKTAHGKLVSELSERIMYFNELNKNSVFLSGSSGFAAHPDIEQARFNAKMELIERWLNQYFRCHPQDLISCYAFTPQIKSWSYYFEAFQVHYNLSRYSTVGAQTSGWGSAIHPIYEKSLEKSTLEAAMTALSLRDFGQRGNAVTCLKGSSRQEQNSIEINIRDLGKLNLYGKTRYIAHAYKVDK